MKIIRNIIIYSLAAIGLLYLVIVYYFSEHPDGGTFRFSGGKCEKNILSSKTSPNYEITAAHIKEVCEDGRIEHILMISYIENNKESLHQIFYSTEIKELSEFKGKIKPLGLEWKSNNKLVLTVQPELNSFTYKHNEIDIVTKIDVYRP